MGKLPVRRIAASAAAGVLVAGCGSAYRHRAAPAPTTSTTVVKAAAVVAQPAKTPALCPLDGLPAPGGRVPSRPALAIKIDNLSAARPQTGVSRADIVYEEPVEGGITRFIAIFQCRDAPRVEPVRSGRLIDPQILSQYGPHVLLGYAGAIAPAVAAIEASPLIDVGVDRAPPSAYWRDPARPAPHNLVTTTAGLFAAGAAEHAPATPPPPPFPFGPLGLGATPAPRPRGRAGRSRRPTWSSCAW